MYVTCHCVDTRTEAPLLQKIKNFNFFSFFIEVKGFLIRVSEGYSFVQKPWFVKTKPFQMNEDFVNSLEL